MRDKILEILNEGVFNPWILMRNEQRADEILELLDEPVDIGYGQTIPRWKYEAFNRGISNNYAPDLPLDEGHG